MKEELQVVKFHPYFDKLQQKYGSKDLDSIYGAGDTHNPDICFVFMNPTGKNVASAKSWHGIKAQWLGTKNIWKLFAATNLLDQDIYQQIMIMKPSDWNYNFSSLLYQNVCEHHYYITNLGKCTQIDARPLSNKVFKEYLTLLEEEIDFIKPKVVVTFGNQVSSIFLNQPICVSQCRGKFFLKEIKGITYKVYPLYYPVGQGMRNINLAIDDIKKIIKDLQSCSTK